MIATLPREIQNKIFFYIGGDITEEDIFFQKKFIQTKKKVCEYGRLNIPSFNLGWNMPAHKISRKLLTELTKVYYGDSDWCKVLFYRTKRARSGITIGELIEYLMFCFYYVCELNTDEVLVVHGDDHVLNRSRFYMLAQKFLDHGACSRGRSETNQAKLIRLSGGNLVKYHILKTVYRQWIVFCQKWNEQALRDRIRRHRRRAAELENIHLRPAHLLYGHL
jgi:hypothetical protein